MSAKITYAVPSGKGAIESGASVCIGVDAVVNQNIGLGTVAELSAYDFEASGKYDFDVLGKKGSGTWSITLKSTDGGNTFGVTLVFTGTFAIHESWTATATESDGTISYTGGKHDVVQSYQDDGLTEKAKIYFATDIQGEGWKFYLYNSNTYGSC